MMEGLTMEKYKELYDLSKEVLNEELNRFTRIDDKAAKYLSVLTLVAGAATFFGKWLIDNLMPPKTALEWILIIVAFLLCVMIFISWCMIFNVLKLHDVTKIPLNDETIKFFDDNELVNIYYALAKGNKEALAKNRITTDLKSKQLYMGYNAIIACGLCLVLFLSFFIAYKWNPQVTKLERSQIMSKEGNQKPQGSEKPSSDKPDPNIKPPTYDVVTEGFDPSKIQTKKEVIEKKK